MGSQYTSEAFEYMLQKYKIRHSYSRKGTPGDNVRIESFHSILKREYAHHMHFSNIDEATAGIYQYIHWYNTDRTNSFVSWYTDYIERNHRNFTVLLHVFKSLHNLQ